MTCSPQSEQEWQALLPAATVTSYAFEEQKVWPEGIVGNPRDLMTILKFSHHSPDWCVAAHPIHDAFAKAMGARFLVPWGTCPRWTFYANEKCRKVLPLRLRQTHRGPPFPTPQVFSSTSGAITIMERMIQRRLHRAYEEMGSASLREGVTDDDFHYASLLRTLATKPFGEITTNDQLLFSQFREWPREPNTEPLVTDPPDPYLLGHEGAPLPLPLPPEAISRDLRKWKREGQSWMGAFMKPAQVKVATFLRQNEAANLKAATAASKRRKLGAKNTSDRRAKFDKVTDVLLTQ